MFVGHYAASFLAKGLEPRAPLAMLFIAAQFLDFVFFPLVLLGSESLTMVANATESTHFELPFMPYSHSLWASLFWCIAVFSISYKLLNFSRTISLLMALVVMAHWVLDLLVHTPDLAVWNIFHQDSVKWGFGLWNNATFAFALECGLLSIAVLFYVKHTHAINKHGKYLIFLYLSLLILIQAFTTFGDLTATNKLAFAWQAIASFVALTLISGYIDRFRKGGQNPDFRVADSLSKHV